MSYGRATQYAHLAVSSVSATTGYLLVDLSATTVFKHVGTTEVHLLGLDLNLEKASDGRFRIQVGVVTRVDATNGDISWIKEWTLEADGNPTDGTDRFDKTIDFTLGGRCLEGVNALVTGGAIQRFVTNSTTTNSTVYQTDTTLTSSSGTAAAPGVGDIVALVTETSGTGNIAYLNLGIFYETA